MKGFDATSTVDSVVACDCGDFPFQTIFYPEYLNLHGLLRRSERARIKDV
jgi:hypothetical protein